MKLHHFFVLTHGVVALTVAGLAIGAARTGATDGIVLSSTVSLVVLAIVAWYVSTRITNSLSILESVVADQDVCQGVDSGLLEFDQSARRIAVDAERWEAVAANNRQQARDFQSMMFLLNRRGPDRPATSGQLRGLLAALGETLHNYLSEVQNAAAEIENGNQSIIAGSDSQNDVVIITTTHLQQLRDAIESVLTLTVDVDAAFETNQELVSNARRAFGQVSTGLQQVRDDSQSCEKKLRTLCDPIQQVNVIVNTISDLASRTDLLALNASIEAVRAGENGKQFAKVADEVRSLADQSADATREITSLLESMRLVLQESIHRVSRGRQVVENQVATAAEAVKSLAEYCRSVDAEAKRIHELHEWCNGQLVLVQNIAVALDKFSDTSKAIRGNAESMIWHSKSLVQSPDDFASVVQRLRQCNGAVVAEKGEQALPSQGAIANPDNVANTSVVNDPSGTVGDRVVGDRVNAASAPPLPVATFVIAE